MNKSYLLVLVSALLLVSFAQSDLQTNVQPSENSGNIIVGGLSTVDISNIDNSVEQELLTEVVERCKVVYNNDSVYSSDPLEKVTEVEKQIVSGLLFKVTFSTKSGKQATISVHIVPWKQGEARFPPVPEPIVVTNSP